MKLTVRRSGDHTNGLIDSQSLLIMLNLNDNRFDRPIFTQSIYEFTLDENTQLGAQIGQLNAIYMSPNPSFESESIRYRIVPFIGGQETTMTYEEADFFTSGLPVRIDPETGILTLRLNLDREKFVMDGLADKLGLIKFSVEASYASMSYSYAKVNIYIRDLNDNAPLARIRPVGARPANRNESAVSTLYVNENALTNQILAYVGVYDPDSGENGTIRSIDISIVDVRRAAESTLRQRRLKLERIKLVAGLSEMVREIEFGLEEEERGGFGGTEIPVRLAKIGEKLFTLQLAKRLSFERVEAYGLELRIRDNGTRPQLESSTRVDLRVIERNKYAPVFLNSPQAEINVIEG